MTTTSRPATPPAAKAPQTAARIRTGTTAEPTDQPAKARPTAARTPTGTMAEPTDQPAKARPTAARTPTGTTAEQTGPLERDRRARAERSARALPPHRHPDSEVRSGPLGRNAASDASRSRLR